MTEKLDVMHLYAVARVRIQLPIGSPQVTSLKPALEAKKMDTISY